MNIKLLILLAFLGLTDTVSAQSVIFHVDTSNRQRYVLIQPKAFYSASMMGMDTATRFMVKLQNDNMQNDTTGVASFEFYFTDFAFNYKRTGVISITGQDYVSWVNSGRSAVWIYDYLIGDTPKLPGVHLLEN